MGLHQYLEQLGNHRELIDIALPISKQLEIAGVLKKLEPQPALFRQVKESGHKVAGNLFASKAAFARYFGIDQRDIIPFFIGAVEHRSPPQVITQAACQEVVHSKPDLDDLPILLHLPGDGGNYITSGVFVARHPQYGQNLDFHRCMQFSKTEMAVRVVKSRHFDTFLSELGEVDVAVCVGLPPNILAAAATSVDLGVDEMEIANAMQPVQVVQAKTVDLVVPAEAEFVIEGTVYADRRHAEGPFVDLTETQDVIRHEPVLVVKAITHRRDAIWHALLPGGLEHKLLMGMPREPTIFRKVNDVVHCLDVNVNPGGCSWLHAIIQIDKQDEQDGKLAIQAAFAGHRSCKHVFIVDQDIDIYNPLEVEWAMATRFQADLDMVVLQRQPGSSLDPSSEPGSHNTTRVGFDLTKPLTTHGKAYHRVQFPEVNLSDYLSTGTNAQSSDLT